MKYRLINFLFCFFLIIFLGSCTIQGPTLERILIMSEMPDAACVLKVLEPFSEAQKVLQQHLEGKEYSQEDKLVLVSIERFFLYPERDKRWFSVDLYQDDSKLIKISLVRRLPEKPDKDDLVQARALMDQVQKAVIVQCSKSTNVTSTKEISKLIDPEIMK